MRHILFYNDESNSIIREKDNFENSIFKEQYIQALDLFQRILNNKNETKSNIIAFCGDRGEGKTSCMMTIKYILEHQKNDKVNAFLQSNKILNLPETQNIEVLDVIEPLFFDEKHDLRDLVLGRLYERICSHSEYEKSISAKREIQKCLFECKHYMKSLLKNREDMYDELEELDLLSGGIFLKQKFDVLFATYLKHINKEHLLIFIDDFDLNMKYAYEMMEFIRKYFSSHHCVIILSCHIDQLEKIVNYNMQREEYCFNFLSTLGTKYINKLLPQNHRIYMPRVKDFCDWPLYLYQSREEHLKEDPDYHSVKEAVVRLIFDKTHYLFYNSKNRVSSIVPDNLRSLRHFINMMVSMEDFKDNKTHEENKKRFKTYFFQVWTHQLADEHLEFVRRLEENNDVMSINKMVVSYLDSHFLNSKSLESDLNWLKEIANPSNSIYNVSVGDALTMIDYLEKRETEKDSCLFLFFLKSFYSIKLYDYYDVVSEIEGSYKPSTQNSQDGEIYKNEAWFKQCNLLQRFVNGAYFSYNPGDLLAKNISDVPRDKKVINGKELRELIKDIQKYDELDNAGKLEFQNKFMLFEYFILCIHRKISQKQKTDFYQVRKPTMQSSYRILSEPHHLTEFNNNIGYFVFDIMAPFYNLLNVEYTYNRFNQAGHGVDIYSFAKSHTWSLLNKMIENCQDENNSISDDNKIELRLLSDSTIRNAEIWMALVELIKQNRQVNKEGGSNNKILSSFYADISSPGMSTYKLSEDNQPHILSFKFLKPIIEFLQEIDSELFDSVFLERETKYQNELPNVQKIFGKYLDNYVSVQGKTITKHWRTQLSDIYSKFPADFIRKINGNSNRIEKLDLINYLNEYENVFRMLVEEPESMVLTESTDQAQLDAHPEANDLADLEALQNE